MEVKSSAYFASRRLPVLLHTSSCNQMPCEIKKCKMNRYLFIPNNVFIFGYIPKTQEYCQADNKKQHSHKEIHKSYKVK